MAFQERVTIFIETKVDNARSQLGSFKQSVNEAQGATGKLKAAAGGISSMIGSVASSVMSPAGLAGAAAGLAAVGGKAIGAFQDLGTAIGNFRDATGLSSQEASRLHEVLSDLGVDPDAAAGAIGRLEKALGTNKDAFKQFGLEVATTKDGLIDANGTFLNAIDALNKIEDPAKRAQAGAAMFGKGWQSMSELISGGAPALKSALDSVQDSKVFNDEDVQKARDLRDALDSVKDAGEGLMITLGKSLAPAIIDLAPKIAEIGTKGEPVVKALGEAFVSTADGVGVLLDALGPVTDALSKLGTIKLPSGEDFNFLTSGALSTASTAWKTLAGDIELTGTTAEGFAANAKAAADAAGVDLSGGAEAAAASVEAMGEAFAAHVDDVKEHAAALKEEVDALNAVSDAFSSAADDQIAYNKAQEDFATKAGDSSAKAEDVRDSAISAAKAHAELYTSMTEASGATATATGKLDAQNQSLLTAAATAKGPARQAILDYTAALNSIPPDVMTEIQAAIDRGDLAEAERLLNEASRNRDATVTADAKTGQAERDLNYAARDRDTTITVKGVLSQNLPSSIQKLLGIQSFTAPAPAPSSAKSATASVQALAAPAAVAQLNALTANRVVKVRFDPSGVDGLLAAFVGSVRKGTSTLVRVNGGGR